MSNKKLVTVTDKQRGRTQSDRDERMLNDLERARDTNYIRIGKVDGVEKVDGLDMPFAVIFEGGVKILIPASEFMDIHTDVNNTRDINEQSEYLLNLRIGSEIDYIVRDVDREKKIAIASRKEAMLKKMLSAYIPEKEGEEPLIGPDTLVEARVVSTFRSGITVEIFGIETPVFIRDLTYARVHDASYHFNVGDIVIVLIKEVDIDLNESTVDIKVSVKEADEHPFDNHTLEENQRVMGSVSYIDDNENVFVLLPDGNTVLCNPPERGGMLIVNQKVIIVITTINEEQKRIFGKIIHTSSI